MSSGDIVQKLWNYCNVLRDDGMSYGDYVEAAPRQLLPALLSAAVPDAALPPPSMESYLPPSMAVAAPGRYRLLPYAALLRPCTARHSNILFSTVDVITVPQDGRRAK
jgi:type I restriction enzyme M protein